MEVVESVSRRKGFINKEVGLWGKIVNKLNRIFATCGVNKRDVRTFGFPTQTSVPFLIIRKENG